MSNDIVNILITVAIVGAIIVIIWSKIMNQSALDTIKEIKEILNELFLR